MIKLSGCCEVLVLLMLSTVMADVMNGGGWTNSWSHALMPKKVLDIQPKLLPCSTCMCMPWMGNIYWYLYLCWVIKRLLFVTMLLAI